MKLLKLNFFITYNILYLGSLLFILIFLGAIIFRGRLESGTAFVWDAQYLNSSFVIGIYLVIFIISILSYFYALWKTWTLTKSDSLFNKSRIIAFVWLCGVPVSIYFSASFWISSMRMITDQIFF